MVFSATIFFRAGEDEDEGVDEDEDEDEGVDGDEVFIMSSTWIFSLSLSALMLSRVICCVLCWFMGCCFFLSLLL